MKNLTKSYPSLPSLITIVLMLFIFVNEGMTDVATNDKSTIDVGVILDLGTWVGSMTNSCISMALEDYYSTHNHTTRLVLHTRDSHGIVDAASSAIDLIKNVQVQAILGPQSSSEAEFLVDIGNKTQVPVISFSTTSPSISSSKTPYFIRTTLNDSTQAKVIAAIVQSFGWREVVPIYEDTDFGGDMIPYLTDAIQDVNARVPYRSVLSPSSTSDQIRDKLYQLMTMRTRVFVVHMTSSLSSRLFSIAKEVGMMTKGYVWIITDGLTDLLSSMDASIVDSMQGVLGIKLHIPKSKKLDTFRNRWQMKFLHDYSEIGSELSAFGLRAYDSVWALAMAVDKVNAVKPKFEKLNVGKNSIDLETLGVSQIGPKLLQSILQTNFNGLSGVFRIKDGQLQLSAFHIVNVIGKGGRDIGFWTPALGISEELKQTGKKVYTTNKDNLGAIIWPGESIVVPIGWEVSTTEDKLKIGVPVKDGFSEFVTVTKDPHTNATMVKGFCIDVFKAVTDAMPYAIPYEFVPFEKDGDQSGRGYNELLDQISFQIYDGVVGDITILANRSKHVEFTLPFTESGVSMAVTTIKGGNRNAWIFLKPLTMDLWLTTGIFFINTGFVVWVLEHRINEDFRGRPTQQIGMIFWFSFSTLVFAHKERVLSNLARFVVIVWVFVVLILTSSYTASLTSMLTVQKYLQPSVADLIKNGDLIGYQSGSFVSELMENIGFDAAKLRPYNSPEEYHEALQKGSQNGGVSAIMDEIPYIKVFLTKYCCERYMMLGPILTTGGFGFAFRKGSPLVPIISSAVLNVTQGEKIKEIERAWFKTQDLGGTTTTISSDSLTLEDFKGLFLIAGVASYVALLLFLLIFLHEQRTILTSEGSISQKISSMAQIFFSRKDITPNESNQKSPERSGREEEKTVADYDRSTPQTPITCISLEEEYMVSSQEESFPSTEPSTRVQDLPSTIEIKLSGFSGSQ